MKILEFANNYGYVVKYQTRLKKKKTHPHYKYFVFCFGLKIIKGFK